MTPTIAKPKRQEFIQCQSRADAVRLAPWAFYLTPVANGWHAFEDWGDYKRWQQAHSR